MRRWLLLALALLPALAAAEERILRFDADILIRADGIIEVTETIAVRAEGRQIRRGIIRDFPTRYRDSHGNRVVVDYTPLSAARNGRQEPFRAEPYANGVRTRIGSAEALLEPGEHVYEFRYEAGRVLGYFGERDELYWNVTGNDSIFPIEQASARVRFEFDVDNLDINAWTGAAGAQGDAWDGQISGAQAQFRTTAPLAPRDGLTILVSWPAGQIARPGEWQRFKWLLRDNRQLLVALVGLLAMLGYYVPVWNRWGRDPAPGVIMTRYEPPAGYSPASLRYVDRMGYDMRAFTAAVVNLAVKGRLRIDEDDDEYTLTQIAPPGDAESLARGEAELLQALFEKGPSVRLEQKNHARIRGAVSAHKAALKSDYLGRYFRNIGWFGLPAALIMVAAFVGVLFSGQQPSPWAVIALGATAVTAAVFGWLMKQPTPRGRKLMDETAGFREYLEIAEKDELNLRNPPEKTPELFERYLPYALALGVEQQWSERFASVFRRLGSEASTPPAWYHGSFDGRNFATKVGAISAGLHDSISASASPPGSSSGSGGGGASGGGGGGGGVGGW